MIQLYQIAANALISEMKRLNPNLLTISDYLYRYWYSLECDGSCSIFDSFSSAVKDLAKMIRIYGLDHIRLNLHWFVSNPDGSVSEKSLYLLPNVQDCYAVLSKAKFPFELTTIGNLSFSNSSCIPTLSEDREIFKNELLFLFYKDLPVYGSDLLVGWLSRRSLETYYGDDMVLASKNFLSPTFVPSPSMTGFQI